MSRAKKCDRCNALYVPAPGCVWLDSYGLFTRDRKANHEDADGGHWNTYEADLCPACSAEFVAWLRVTLEGGEIPDDAPKVLIQGGHRLLVGKPCAYLKCATCHVEMGEPHVEPPEGQIP